MGQLVQPVAVKVSQRSLSTGDISVVVTEPEVRNTSSDSDLSSQSATSQLDLNSSESATDSDTGSSSSSISVGYAMANRPQIKFLSPPIFKGLPDEDALDWLDRYEKTGAIQNCGKTLICTWMWPLRSGFSARPYQQTGWIFRFAQIQPIPTIISRLLLVSGLHFCGNFNRPILECFRKQN